MKEQEKSPEKKGDFNSLKEEKNNNSEIQEKPKQSKKLLDKLEDSNIDLDYSNLLISAMGHWLSVSAFSVLEDIFEDGIIGPAKISDDIGDALDLMFKEGKSSEKKDTPLIQEQIEIPSNQLITVVEDMKKKGCRFFENLIFSVFEEPVELTTIEIVKRLSRGESPKNLDIVTENGHGHSIFNVEDLESINKYGLPRTEKEFLEDEVLNKLKNENIIMEPEDVKSTPLYPLSEISMGQYLDNGGVLFLKKPQGKIEEIRSRDQLWHIDPLLMAKSREEFLGIPNYINLTGKNS